MVSCLIPALEMTVELASAIRVYDADLEILRSYVIINGFSQHLRGVTLLPEETNKFERSEVVDADYGESPPPFRRSMKGP